MARPNLGITIFLVGRDEELWDEEAHRAREAGAEHLEVFLEYPPGNGELRERQVRRLRNLVKGVKVLVHAPVSWTSLITPHERLWQLSLQEVKETLLVAGKLNSQLVTIHGGPLPFPSFRHGQDACERFKGAVDELLSLARELSLPLAVENLAAGYPSAPEELEEAMAAGLRWSFNVDQAREGGQDPLDWLKRFYGRMVRVTLGPQAEPESLVNYLREESFEGFLTLSFPPDRGRWARVRESLVALREAWERA
jgi:sugar phosphate isomerase/epimerase